MDEQSEQTHGSPKRPTPQFKYIPPPKTRNQSRLSDNNTDGEFRPIYIPRNQTLNDAMKRYLKENPLVAIGAIGILASFGTGLTLFYRGVHPVWEERMMWSRCTFQALTALAIGYSEYKRVKEVEKIYKQYTPEQINQVI
ncbi:hypothetical protein LOTGIDRAFT_231738, partial [Lottia gigantea]